MVSKRHDYPEGDVYTAEGVDWVVDQLTSSIKELEKLLQVAACPSNCIDGAVPTGGPNPDGEWEASQCQFCYERDLLIKELGET
jgi:hypothetical protein